MFWVQLQTFKIRWEKGEGQIDTLLAQHDVTVDHTMLSGVVKLSNLQCSTICDNVCWTMLRGHFKLTYICWTTNQIYIAIICSQIFIRKAQLVAHSLHKAEVPGSNPRHPTWQSFSSFQCMMIFCLNVIFIFLFILFFSNWCGLDIHSTFHANFCSFLIFHEFESTDISIPQQLLARGRHVYSFLSASSAATQFARLW